MTNRNRSRAPRRPRRRTGRLVWVNRHIESGMAVDTLLSLDMLTAASEFMVFDTTIVAVVINDLVLRLTTDATSGLRQVRCALVTGKDTLDAADFDDSLFANSIGPSYMWFGGNSLQTAAISNVTLPLTPVGEPVLVKSSRRFRENNQTLWLVAENRVNAGDSALQLNGHLRALIRIP